MASPPRARSTSASRSRTSPWPKRRCWRGCRRRPRPYNPIANPKRANERQQYIIDRMLENGFITPDQHAAAQGAAAALPPADRGRRACRIRGRGRAPADLQPVRRRRLHARAERLPDDQFERTDGRLPCVAARASWTYERRQVYRGPEAYVDLPADPNDLDARVAEALPGPSRQRRAEGRGRARGEPEEGRRDAAERRVGDDHRRRSAPGHLGPGAQGQSEDARSAAAR